jgi:GNAT superfamily N-acetyltransferase
MRITTEEVTPDLWPQLESLFGANGACGGCWCQAWRVEKGERWDDIKGSIARERLCAGIRNGSMYGILAFDEARPVGWCTFGPRNSFPRINRARTLKCDDSAQVWSIPCFFVARGCRRQGVATALLKHALRAIKGRGGLIAEAYPSKPDETGRYIDTFAWTGTQALFQKAGFRVVGNPAGSRQRVRKVFRSPTQAKRLRRNSQPGGIRLEGR